MPEVVFNTRVSIAAAGERQVVLEPSSSVYYNNFSNAFTQMIM